MFDVELVPGLLGFRSTFPWPYGLLGIGLSGDHISRIGYVSTGPQWLWYTTETRRPDSNIPLPFPRFVDPFGWLYGPAWLSYEVEPRN